MHQEMGTLNETGLCMINVVFRGTPWTLVPSDLPTHLSLPLGIYPPLSAISFFFVQFILNSYIYLISFSHLFNFVTTIYLFIYYS